MIGTYVELVKDTYTPTIDQSIELTPVLELAVTVTVSGGTDKQEQALETLEAGNWATKGGSDNEGEGGFDVDLFCREEVAVLYVNQEVTSRLVRTLGNTLLALLLVRSP